MVQEFGTDNAELYLEEREREQRAEQQRRLQIPGLVKPSVRDQEATMD